MNQMWHDLRWGVPPLQPGRCGYEGSEETEEGGVRVDVVERGTVVDLGEVIENVRV